MTHCYLHSASEWCDLAGVAPVPGCSYQTATLGVRLAGQGCWCCTCRSSLPLSYMSPCQNTVKPLWKGHECLTKVAKIWSISMHHSLQIMFILPLMTGHLFWKATILGGLYRGVPLYFFYLRRQHAVALVGRSLSPSHKMSAILISAMAAQYLLPEETYKLTITENIWL